MIRDGCRKMSEGEFQMQMNLVKRSHTPIKPFFNGIKTMPIVTQGKGVSNNTKVH